MTLKSKYHRINMTLKSKYHRSNMNLMSKYHRTNMTLKRKYHRINMTLSEVLSLLQKYKHKMIVHTGDNYTNKLYNMIYTYKHYT